MILVTGASGHVGNVLVRQLLAEGQLVRALVRSASSPVALADLDLEIAHGDILDTASLERAMQGVELVYHLAARIHLGSGADPETERANLEGTRNLIEAIRRAGRPRLVYASSVYALHKPPHGAPIDESQPYDPDQALGPYDRSKALASLAVQAAAADGMQACIVCPSAVTGPYDFHASETGRAIRLYMRRGIKFYVQGAYDFVDVRDVARGCILAAQHGRRGESYILSGDRMTLREVIRIVAQAAGTWQAGIKIPLRVAYIVAKLMPVYAKLSGLTPIFTRYSLDAVSSNSFISHAKAERALGFSPRPARQSILDAVSWYQRGAAFDAPFPAARPNPTD